MVCSCFSSEEVRKNRIEFLKRLEAKSSVADSVPKCEVAAEPVPSLSDNSVVPDGASSVESEQHCSEPSMTDNAGVFPSVPPLSDNSVVPDGASSVASNVECEQHCSESSMTDNAGVFPECAVTDSGLDQVVPSLSAVVPSECAVTKSNVLQCTDSAAPLQFSFNFHIGKSSITVISLLQNNSEF